METSHGEDLVHEKQVGLIEFYEGVFGWPVIKWDEVRKTWKVRRSLSTGYREIDNSIISLNPKTVLFTGEEAEFNPFVGSIEVEKIENYTGKIKEFQGKIDDGSIVRNPDGSRMNVGVDSTGRTFVLVEHTVQDNDRVAGSESG